MSSNPSIQPLLLLGFCKCDRDGPGSAETEGSRERTGALPLRSTEVLETSVIWPGPGPRMNVSLALFHLQASIGMYRRVREWIESLDQSLLTLRRMDSCCQLAVTAIHHQRTSMP